MGLHNQLTDVSSDSLPIFLLSTIATGACYLHSLLLTFLHSLGIIISSPYHNHNHNHNQPDDVINDAIGSGLAGLIILADQLNLNRVFSYKYRLCDDGSDQVNDQCVMCLNSLTDGDHVRKLACRHVFHKECFDGWLDCLNFKCPICRSPLVSDERVDVTRRRVTDDVMSWFSLR